MYCHSCGKPLPDGSARCPYCAALQISSMDATQHALAPPEGKSWVVTLLLCLLLPGLGVHRFYTGNILLGLLHLFTGGGCGVLVIVDFFLIIFDSYHDGEGQNLVK